MHSKAAQHPFYYPVMTGPEHTFGPSKIGNEKNHSSLCSCEARSFALLIHCSNVSCEIVAPDALVLISCPRSSTITVSATSIRGSSNAVGSERTCDLDNLERVSKMSWNEKKKGERTFLTRQKMLKRNFAPIVAVIEFFSNMSCVPFLRCTWLLVE